jgi:hypothetical protein
MKEICFIYIIPFLYFVILIIISDRFIKKNDLKTANKIGNFGLITFLLFAGIAFLIKALTQ